MSPIAQAVNYSAQVAYIWSDQLPPFRQAMVLREEGEQSVNLAAVVITEDPSTMEWLALAESAFESWDNPIDAAYDEF
ncbi:MAG: hypothetical protein H6649_11290 [Caldilineae bacterium]|nr:hypothetical protein [Caldilineae bacterium]